MEVKLVQPMLVRIENFVGAAMTTFAAVTAIISPYHRYTLYAAIAGVGLVSLLLAQRSR
jgi:hypothetical protein